MHHVSLDVEFVFGYLSPRSETKDQDMDVNVKKRNERKMNAICDKRSLADRIKDNRL